MMVIKYDDAEYPFIMRTHLKPAEFCSGGYGSCPWGPLADPFGGAGGREGTLNGEDVGKG